MQYNRLGNTGLLVSQLGFGNMVNFQPEDEEVNVAIIKRAYEAGINFFDTAELFLIPIYYSHKLSQPSFAFMNIIFYSIVLVINMEKLKSNLVDPLKYLQQI